MVLDIGNFLPYLLERLDVQQVINKLWNEYWFKDPRRDQKTFEWWSSFKNRIKNYLISKGKEISKERKFQKEELEKEINSLQNSWSSSSKDSLNLEIKDKIDQLQKIIDFEIEGAKIRTRAKWLTEGEKNTKYFFHLAAAKKAKSKIGALNYKNVIAVGSALSEVVFRYYSKLFSKKKTCSKSIERILLLTKSFHSKNSFSSLEKELDFGKYFGFNTKNKIKQITWT